MTRTWARGRRCSICGTLLGRYQYSTACSRRCGGLLQRKRAEARYDLNAFGEWSEDMAYALGLFFSDGCLRSQARGSMRVMFDNTDLSTVEWWHSYLGNPTQISHIRRESPHQDIYRSTATSDTIGHRLSGFGAIQRKSTEPVRVPDVPGALMPHFIRGYLDGDGHLGMHPNRKMKGGLNLSGCLVSNSSLFRDDLRCILNTRGVHTSDGRIHLQFAGSSAERFCQWIYGCGGQFMHRKRAVWDAWCDFREDYGGLIFESDPYQSLRGVQPKWWHSLIGTMPDGDVAEVAGVSYGNVHAVRKKLKIDLVPTPKPARPSRPWHVLAGTMKDADVAEVGGVSKSMVCTYRREMGISSFQSQKRVSP